MKVSNLIQPEKERPLHRGRSYRQGLAERERGLIRIRIRKQNQHESLPKVWGDFLAHWPWSWFTTNTFRNEVHPEAAGKTWNLWIHQLNRDIFGNRYWKRQGDGVIWARGEEYQRRGVIHFHALIGHIPSTVRRLDWMDRWNELAGFARVEAYDPAKGARYYLGKYVLKGGQVDLGGPLRTHAPLFEGLELRPGCGDS